MAGESFGWPIEHVPQQDSMSCWAACVAMMVNYRDGTTYDDSSIREATGISAPAGATDEDWADQLIPQFGLVHVAGSCLTPEGWQELINSGPTIVGITRHVVVCSGLSSDGTESGTQLYMCDPARSSPEYWTFADTTNKWEMRANRDMHMVQLR